MEFSRQEYWEWVAMTSSSGSYSEIESKSPESPALAGGFFAT